MGIARYYRDELKISTPPIDGQPHIRAKLRSLFLETEKQLPTPDTAEALDPDNQDIKELFSGPFGPLTQAFLFCCDRWRSQIQRGAPWIDPPLCIPRLVFDGVVPWRVCELPLELWPVVFSVGSSATPLSNLPVRVLQVPVLSGDKTAIDPSLPSYLVPELIKKVFHPPGQTEPLQGAEGIFRAELLQPMTPDELQRLDTPCEILHLTGIAPMDMEHWIHRLAWRGVRLLVLELASAYQWLMPKALDFALEISSRLGCSVLVHEPTKETPRFFGEFYDALVHDRPLDLAMRLAAFEAGGRSALISGHRGEDLLRFASLAQRISIESKAVTAQTNVFSRAAQTIDPTVEELQTKNNALTSSLGELNFNWESKGVLPLQKKRAQLAEVRGLLDSLTNNARAISKNTSSGHESIQLDPPEARYVNAWLQNLPEQNAPPVLLSPEESLYPKKYYELCLQIGALKKGSLILNATALAPNLIEQIVNRGGDWLEVAVFSRDFEVSTAGPIDLSLPEIPQGQALQRLWLPKVGDSEELCFDVIPKCSGLGYLRICVYYKNQPLQSIRLEAKVRMRDGFGLQQLPQLGQAEEEALSRSGISSLSALIEQEEKLRNIPEIYGRRFWEWPSIAKALLASPEDPLETIPEITTKQVAKLRSCGVSSIEALAGLAPETVEEKAKELGVTPERLGQWCEDARTLIEPFGNRAKIEYSLSANLNSPSEQQQRGLSIATNRGPHRESHFFGVKFGEWDEGWGEGDDWVYSVLLSEAAIAKNLKELRDKIDQGSIGRNEKEKRDYYAFNTTTNEGREDRCKTLLAMMAKYGSYFHTSIFGDLETRAKLKAKLEQPGQVIHIARVQGEHVLPWSLLYDEPLLDVIEEKDLQVCLSLIENKTANQPLDYGTCRAQSSCPLSRPNGNRWVCPWGFWGVKHNVEQPAQTVEKETPEPRDLIREIEGKTKPNIAMNVSLQLEDFSTHCNELAGLKTGVTVLLQDSYDKVIAALKSQDHQIIYFYCHGGSTKQPERQGLWVGSSTDIPIVDGTLLTEKISWSKPPLVFINGCHTAALEPSLLSDFIKRFAGCGAAGVIGTEIRVWEPLAKEIARHFFNQFLSGVSVGESLRYARHQLLKKRNPLGLVYTAYCSADLRLS